MSKESIKLLGSHDAMTYLKPNCFMSYIMRPFSRCQRVDLNDQYELGSRCFDLRVYLHDEKWYFKHSIYKLTRSVSLDDVMYILSSFEGIYVRLILEENRSLWGIITGKYEADENQSNKFIELCNDLVKKYPDIKFMGGYRRFDWKYLYSFEYNNVPLHQMTSSMDEDNKNILAKIFPKFYARKYNKKNIANMSDGITLIDFVDIC